MKKNLLIAALLMLCCMLPACKGEEQPLKVEAEKDHLAAPGLIGSYLELEQGSYQVDFNQELTKASVSLKFKIATAVIAKDVEVKIAVLDANHKPLCDMKSDDKAFAAAMGEAGKTFTVKFDADINQQQADSLKANAKYVSIVEAEGNLTYPATGTIAGKPVEVVLEIDTEDGYVYGGYRYSKISGEALIAIKGKYDKKTNGLTIVETYNGMYTGNWQITLNPKDGAKFKGKMTNSRNHTYPVILSEDTSLSALKVPEPAYEDVDETIRMLPAEFSSAPLDGVEEYAVEEYGAEEEF